MDKFYYDAVDEMQRMKVERNYMLGWIGGYMGNPKVEEQRITESYQAGYTDGESRDVSHFGCWAVKR